MSASQPTVVMMGECMVELRRDASGAIQQSFAGDVYNACVYMKRVFPQLNVALATQLGRDTLSSEMIAAFESESISTDLVLQDEKRLPGMYWVQTDENGERSFLYWRENAAARWQTTQYGPSHIEKLKQADMFFFSGISLAILIEAHRETFWALLEELKLAGVKIVFDPNYRERLWKDKADTKAQYDLAFKVSDIVLPGVEDFAFLYELDSFATVSQFFEHYQVPELIIKDGPNGVMVVNNGESQLFEIEEVTNVVDTTSAGDSFNGAFLGARLAGHDYKEAIHIASKTAGFVIQHPGAIVESDTFSSFARDLKPAV